MGIRREDVCLKPAESARDKALCRSIIEKYHSYVPSYNSVGRRIDYLIFLHGEAVGVIGIGSSTYPPCKDILKYLKIDKSEYRRIFNTIGNNWRFCLKSNPKNLGTIALSKFRIAVSRDWYVKYGDELKYIITFVGAGHSGAVYKADNWEMIGETAGLPKHRAVSMKWDSGEVLKEKFVKPTGENKKLIFIKKIQHSNKLAKRKYEGG